MKTALIPMVLWMSLSLSDAASKDKTQPIPKEKEGRWGLYTFDEAKEEAAKKKRPLVVLLVDERSEEASIKEAGEFAFWSLSKDTSIVVILSNLLGSGKGRLGDQVYGALTSAEMGKGMPRLVVTTPAADVILGQLSADQLIAADEKLLKSFGKQMEASNKNPPPAKSSIGPAMAATATATSSEAASASLSGNNGSIVIKDSQIESWTNIEGVTIQAALAEAHPDKVVFLMNGNKVDYPLAKLNEASRTRIEALRAASLQ